MKGIEPDEQETFDKIVQAMRAGERLTGERYGRSVRTLHAPGQQPFVDENLLFCPLHSLAAHRPLGSVMRARLYVYEVLGPLRRASDNRPATEPRSLAEIPD